MLTCLIQYTAWVTPKWPKTLKRLHLDIWSVLRWDLATIVCLYLLPFIRSKNRTPVRDQPWDLFGRNDAKAETPVLWPPHAKSWLIGKDSDAGRDWGQEEKGTTEDEMVGWHHWLNGRESEWTPGVGDGQGGLACCDSWGHKELDRTERLNWTDRECLYRNKSDYDLSDASPPCFTPSKFFTVWGFIQ